MKRKFSTGRQCVIRRYGICWLCFVHQKEEAEAYACAKKSLQIPWKKVQADKKLQMIGPADAAVAKVNDIYKKSTLFQTPGLWCVDCR